MLTWEPRTSKYSTDVSIAEVKGNEVMSLTDSWTPEELAYFAEKEGKRRQIDRQRCHAYQAHKRQLVLESLGSECANCGEAGWHINCR